MPNTTDFQEAIRELAKLLKITELTVKKNNSDQPCYFANKHQLNENTFDALKEVVFVNYNEPF